VLSRLTQRARSSAFRQPASQVSIVLALLVTGCAADAPPATAPMPPARSVNSMTINDAKRSYILRLPPKYDGKAKIPVVMLLNGANDSAQYAEEAYHFAEKGDANNFTTVFPEALGEFHGWNGIGDSDSAKADVAFLSALLEKLPKDYAIDPHKMYVSGHSMG